MSSKIFCYTKIKKILITAFFIIMMFLSFFSAPAIGQDAQGLNDELSSELHSLDIITMAIDKNGRFWIGTNGQGVRVYEDLNDESPGVYTKENSSLASNYINDIYIQGDIVWIATQYGGLCKYDPNSRYPWRIYNREQGYLFVDNVTTIVADLEGNLWVGTIGGGLAFYNRDNNTWNSHTYRNKYENNEVLGPLSGNNIYCIYIDPQNNKWFGSNWGIVNKLSSDNMTWEYYQINPAGAYNAYVSSITMDEAGNMWFSTYNGGLSQLTSTRDILNIYTIPPMANLSEAIRNNQINGQRYISQNTLCSGGFSARYKNQIINDGQYRLSLLTFGGITDTAEKLFYNLTNYIYKNYNFNDKPQTGDDGYHNLRAGYGTAYLSKDGENILEAYPLSVQYQGKNFNLPVISDFIVPNPGIKISSVTTVNNIPAYIENIGIRGLIVDKTSGGTWLITDLGLTLWDAKGQWINYSSANSVLKSGQIINDFLVCDNLILLGSNQGLIKLGQVPLAINPISSNFYINTSPKEFIINGTGFTEDSEVFLKDTSGTESPCTSVTYLDSSALIVKVPSSISTGAYDIIVHRGETTGSLTNGFYSFGFVDSDLDGIDDINDPDDDNDGLSDQFELEKSKTDPHLKDTDGNGIADGDEDFDGDGFRNKDESIRGTNPLDQHSWPKTEQGWNVILSPGWNAVGLAVAPSTDQTARTLCEEMNNTGAEIQEIDHFLSGVWEGYICGMESNNFSLSQRQGYFIQSETEGTWAQEGIDIPSPFIINLNIGWNIVTFPTWISGAFNAQLLIDLINEQAGEICEEVDQFIAGAWQGHIDGHPFNNFPIIPGLAYAVKCRDGGTLRLERSKAESESKLTVILQQGRYGYNGGKDIFITAISSGGDSVEGEAYLECSREDVEKSKIFIYFDTNGIIPEGVTILEAKLKLFNVNRGEQDDKPLEISASMMTSDWLNNLGISEATNLKKRYSQSADNYQPPLYYAIPPYFYNPMYFYNPAYYQNYYQLFYQYIPYWIWSYPGYYFSFTGQLYSTFLDKITLYPRLETSPLAGEWISLNITEAVRSWHNGTAPNYGITVKAEVKAEDSPEEIKYVFNSNEFPETNFRPCLEIIYKDPQPSLAISPEDVIRAYPPYFEDTLEGLIPHPKYPPHVTEIPPIPVEKLVDELEITVVRPNLGQPFILTPVDIQEGFENVQEGFEITIASYQSLHIPLTNPDYTSNGISYSDFIKLCLQHSPLFKMQSGNHIMDLNIIEVKEPTIYSYETDSHEPPRSSREHQYKAGYRWECQVKINYDLSRGGWPPSGTWPAMYNITLGGNTNYHAIYITENPPDPNNFRFMHITDLHIAGRNDILPVFLDPNPTLYTLSEFRSRYINYNDNLRAVIKYANEKADKRELDFIIVTGDIVDYMLDGCDPSGFYDYSRRIHLYPEATNNNFKTFVDIIAGLDRKGESLKIPIYTVSGNHDYLHNEPPLALDVWIDHPGLADCLILFINTLGNLLFDAWNFETQPSPSKNGAVDKYKAYNITMNEALEFEWWKRNERYQNYQPKYELGDALKFLHQHYYRHSRSYLKYINYDEDFKFCIGAHQFVCLNSGEDIGLPSKNTIIFEEVGIINFTRLEDHYVTQDSHNRGLIQTHYNLLNKAKIDAGDSGYIFLFSHAPLINLQDMKAQDMKALESKDCAITPCCDTINSEISYDDINKNNCGEQLDSILDVEYEFDEAIKICETLYPGFDCNSLFERFTYLEYFNKVDYDRDVGEGLFQLVGCNGKGFTASFAGHTHNKPVEYSVGVSLINSQNSNKEISVTFCQGHYSDSEMPKCYDTWFNEHGPLFFNSGSLTRIHPMVREVHIENNCLTEARMNYYVPRFTQKAATGNMIWFLEGMHACLPWWTNSMYDQIQGMNPYPYYPEFVNLDQEIIMWVMIRSFMHEIDTVQHIMNLKPTDLMLDYKPEGMELTPAQIEAITHNQALINTIEVTKELERKLVYERCGWFSENEVPLWAKQIECEKVAAANILVWLNRFGLIETKGECGDLLSLQTQADLDYSVLKDRITDGVFRLFDFHSENGKNPLVYFWLWYAFESTYLAELGGYEYPNYNSLCPADHLNQAENLKENALGTLIKKYEDQINIQEEKGLDCLKKFYSITNARLAAWMDDSYLTDLNPNKYMQECANCGYSDIKNRLISKVYDVALKFYPYPLPQPCLYISTDIIDFGPTGINTTHTKTLKLSNKGTGNLNITDIQLGVDNTNDFSFITDRGASLQDTSLILKPGEESIISISFSPKAIKLYIGKLIITTNDLINLTKEVTLKGEGTHWLYANPEAINFGFVGGFDCDLANMNNCNVFKKEIRLNNIGIEPLEITNIIIEIIKQPDLTGQYLPEKFKTFYCNLTTPFILAPNASKSLELFFQVPHKLKTIPISVEEFEYVLIPIGGEYTAMLTITTNYPDRPQIEIPISVQVIILP